MNNIPAAQQPGRETDLGAVAAPAPELLVVSETAEGLGHDPPQDERRHAPDGVADAFDRGTEIIVHQAEGHATIADNTDRTANGTSPATLDPAGPLSQNGEPRRTLHLSLSQDNTYLLNPQPHDAAGSSAPERAAVSAAGGQQRGLSSPSSQPNLPANTLAANGGALRMTPEPHRTRDGSAFIDEALRARVEGDITAFLVAFDAALAHDTLESRTGLREATDRLLRAGARTRIELERLEARIPLPVRDNGGAPVSTWRPR